MKPRSLKRPVGGTLLALLACQLLSGCVILPVPAYRPRAAVVVDVGPAYAHGQPPAPPPRGGYHERGWR